MVTLFTSFRIPPDKDLNREFAVKMSNFKIKIVGLCGRKICNNFYFPFFFSENMMTYHRRCFLKINDTHFPQVKTYDMDETPLTVKVCIR